MKFLVDAHLPPSLARLLREAGHDAAHTSQLPLGNRTGDGVLRQLCTSEARVLVTKDTDFYYSHLLHGEPPKLVLVRVGNLKARELTAVFLQHLPRVIQSLQHGNLVELTKSEPV
jgi:predicted nuclease of predicted toxin-antitoxin system